MSDPVPIDAEARPLGVGVEAIKYCIIRRFECPGVLCERLGNASVSESRFKGARGGLR